MIFVFSGEIKIKILRQVLDIVTLCLDVPCAYDFQRNRCTGNAEMLGIWEIQFSIEQLWL